MTLRRILPGEVTEEEWNIWWETKNLLDYTGNRKLNVGYEEANKDTYK